MTIDFDEIIDRTQSQTVKYDARKAVFGTEDVMPLWVADMDFATPECVTAALTQRAQHPIYGYSLYPESLFESLQAWFQHRHGWTIDRQAIVMCSGVVPSIYAVILALTEVGDKVIVQPPIYPPFFTAVTDTERELVLNPLKLVGEEYQFDLDHLEQCAKEGGKLLALCSPHNPVGRVWRQEELQAILSIARQYQLIIIADEIHADLIYPEQQHIPLATLIDLADDITVITTVSPSKTFNIPGLGLSSLIVNDRQHRQAINKVFASWHSNAVNPFSIVAFEAAYRGGEQWLDELMVYLAETQWQLTGFIEQNIPKIKVIPSQGTYLIWLDCRGLELDDKALKHLFIEQARIGLNAGISFGEQGSGFMRMNIAAPRSVIMRALKQIQTVI